MFKLSIEVKTLEDLSDVVQKLGGHAVAGKIEADTAPVVEAVNETVRTATNARTRKAELKEKADSLGVKYAARDTADIIEAKIEAHLNTPVDPAPVMPEPVAQPAPVMPEPVAQPVVQAVSNFNKQQALQEIVAKLNECQTAGIPQEQIFPLIQTELGKVGAPINLRLSEQSDAHLEAAYAGVMSAIGTLLTASQTSSFV